MYEEVNKIKHLIDDAKTVLVIQADNPDADSLGSALSLEHILGDMGKEVVLYCGADMPGYLRYMSGWDRVSQEIPINFDLSILVDASTMTLLDKLISAGQIGKISSKPSIVLDHHSSVENIVPFATVMINDGEKSSAGEVIYDISKSLNLPMSIQAQECLMSCILGDTQGLSNQLAKPATYRAVADMIEAGVDRQKLEELRREYGKMPVEIFKYKSDLIKRTSFDVNGAVATVIIPQAEINQYSPLYNPAPLIQNDMLQTQSVLVAAVFKSYADGKVTAAIRCNMAAPIGAKLAEHFGGGGHELASGFKITDGRQVDNIRANFIQYSTELLNSLSEHD